MSRVAFGLKAHSGWAALVALREDPRAGALAVVDRRRLELAVPGWSVAEILGVHARMHQAEGELFRGALVGGAQRAGLGVMGVREKELEVRAAEVLRLPAEERAARLAEAGRRAGPPWARDQKVAALAAWIALRGAAR